MRFIHKLMLVAFVLALTACLPSNSVPADNGVVVWHDDDKDVTCWIWVGMEKGGISCIPDWQLEPPHD